jgi:hypothetical protein
MTACLHQAECGSASSTAPLAVENEGGEEEDTEGNSDCDESSDRWNTRTNSIRQQRRCPGPVMIARTKFARRPV